MQQVYPTYPSSIFYEGLAVSWVYRKKEAEGKGIIIFSVWDYDHGLESDSHPVIEKKGERKDRKRVMERIKGLRYQVIHFNLLARRRNPGPKSC